MKNATSANQSSVLTQQVNDTKVRSVFKIELCINELLFRSSDGMNELEALAAYGETCLHSSISNLANKYGIIIHRKSQPHKLKRGGKTYFTRYSLTDGNSINKAQRLLEHYAKARGIRRASA